VQTAIAWINGMRRRLSPFWQVQIGGWVCFMLLSIPFKVSLFGSLEAALLITWFREPLGFGLTTGMRAIFVRLKLSSNALGRLALWVIPICFLTGALDLLISYQVMGIMDLQIDQGADAMWSFRTMIYMAWSFLYFWIRDYHAARTRILELARAESAAREAELLMLRAQVSPHFLFNAFNTILADLESRSETLSTVVLGLSDYFRYSLVNRNSMFVSIGEEFDAVTNYFTVEKARFRDSLIIESSIDPAVRATPVPGVFLQPLVENALKHGHQTSPTPLRVRLEVSAAASGGIVVTVTNSGTWIEPLVPRPVGDAGGSGLATLRRRLELLYPNAHRMSAGANAAGDAVIVRVEIPAQTAGVGG